MGCEHTRRNQTAPRPGGSGLRPGSGLALLALLAVVAICGCASTPLSTTQLRSQAARICAAAQAHTDRIPVPGSPAGAAAFIKQGTAVLSAELARLKALRPASDLAGAYKTALLSFSRELDALRVSVRRLHRGADPVIATKTLQQRLGPIESKEDNAWQALGISSCMNR